MLERKNIADKFDNSEKIVVLEASFDKKSGLLKGDSLAILKTLPNETFDLVVTSPPYNIGKEYEKQTDLKEYLTFQTEILKELFNYTYVRWLIWFARYNLGNGWLAWF